jgi:histidine triad (HIT) family protein
LKCVFCSIVSDELASYRVYEDEAIIAFLDRNPATTGHTLIVPRRHVADIWSIDRETAATVMRVAVTVSDNLRRAFDLSGLNLVQSNGALAGQSVFHFHLHLIPRRVNDGLAPIWHGTAADESELGNVANQIRRASEQFGDE